jgi:N-methylhydantoinase A
MSPTVTDADLLLGYYDPENYAGGSIRLAPKRARLAMEELSDDLDLEPIEASKLVRRTVDHDMANGIATELRTRGYDPREFTVLAYGGNGPLHCCGVADALGVDRILAPPFSSLFSACGAGTLNQLHIHEESVFLVLFDANRKSLFTDLARFNRIVEELERRGRADLFRQGMRAEDVRHRVELDMRYGNQRVQTTTVTDRARLEGVHDVLRLIEQFHGAYGRRYGEGSQAPEAGVRINTIRVSSYVDLPALRFADVTPLPKKTPLPEPRGRRPCHFLGHAGALETAIYDESALEPGVVLRGPAIVTTTATTYLVEPGWEYEAAAERAVWFRRVGARSH